MEVLSSAFEASHSTVSFLSSSFCSSFLLVFCHEPSQTGTTPFATPTPILFNRNIRTSQTGKGGQSFRVLVPVRWRHCQAADVQCIVDYRKNGKNFFCRDGPFASNKHVCCWFDGYMKYACNKREGFGTNQRDEVMVLSRRPCMNFLNTVCLVIRVPTLSHTSSPCPKAHLEVLAPTL